MRYRVELFEIWYNAHIDHFFTFEYKYNQVKLKTMYSDTHNRMIVGKHTLFAYDMLQKLDISNIFSLQT